MATANVGLMNGCPVRQPGGVVVGDKIRKIVTLCESAVGRKRAFVGEAEIQFLSIRKTTAQKLKFQKPIEYLHLV